MTPSSHSDDTDLHLQATFQLVRVFRERTEYARAYQLPFNVVSVCTGENARCPSTVRDSMTGQVYTFRENDISFVPLNTPAFYRYTLANEHLCIFFTLELFPGADVFTGRPGRMVINSPDLRQEAESIFSLSDPVRRLAACQQFALGIALRYWPEKYMFDLGRKHAFVPLLTHLRTHLSAHLTVGELARFQGESEGYFTRHFSETFGLSPKQFLQRELFAKAARLLLAPDMNVKTTAVALGFSSEFYFSKFFKRLAGIAPKDYRAQIQQHQNIRK